MPRPPEFEGPHFTIQALALADGTCPAGDFLDALASSDRRKLDILFERLGDFGKISNVEKFKKVEGSDDIWEFKSFQIRLFCFSRRDVASCSPLAFERRGTNTDGRILIVPNRTDSNSSHESDRPRNREWTKRQTASSAARREYEQERLIVAAFESLAEAMESAGLSYADLARALGCSRSHITQLFSGQRNATLRTVADLAWACRSRALLAIEPLRNKAVIDGAASVYRSKAFYVAETATGSAGHAPAAHRHRRPGVRRKA